MSDYVTRVTEWTRCRFAALDRGAVTTETAIITGIIAVAASGLAVYIVGRISYFQSLIP